MGFLAAFAASNAAGIEFLKTELSLAGTFLDVGETTKLSEQRTRSHGDALKAYQAVLHFLPRLQLSLEEKLSFDLELAALKERLMLAGIQL